jgi:hypothetical protein
VTNVSAESARRKLTVITGVLATLRLLFARQAKGKRKLVLKGFFTKLSKLPRSRRETWGADQLQTFFSQGYVLPRVSLWALQGTVLK